MHHAKGTISNCKPQEINGVLPGQDPPSTNAFEVFEHTKFFSAILTISSISISITGIPHSICSVLISSFNKRICLSKDKLIFPPQREK